jgi:hypothetical protein
MAHEPGLVGDLLLSDFASCMSRPQAPTSQDLRAWKAEKGIGLGSAEEDVLKAYGRPSRQDGISKTTYRWVIQGDRSAGDLKPERGSRVLVYQGAKHDLSIAEFGFRDGKVVWIFLSINE